MRIYFAGQFPSLFGTWMEATAILWQVAQLAPTNHKATFVGLAAALQTIPSMVFGPFGGALMDKHGLLKMYVTSQTLAMTVAAVLATLSFLGLSTLPLVMTCAAALGIIQIIDRPAQNAVVGILVTPKNLKHATGMSTAMIAAGMTIGGATAGLVIAHYGPSWAFLTNALSFPFAIGALLLVRPIQAMKQSSASPLTMFIEGGKLIRTERKIRTPLIIGGLVILLGFAYQRVMVIIAQQMFNGDPRTYGYLLAASGVGAIVGGAWAGTSQANHTIFATARRSLVVAGIALMAFSYTHDLHLAYIELFAVGAMITQAHPAIRAELQRACGEQMIGRIMGWGVTFNFTALSIGSLGAGFMIQHFGSSIDLKVNAILAIVAGLAVPLLE